MRRVFQGVAAAMVVALSAMALPVAAVPLAPSSRPADAPSSRPADAAARPYPGLAIGTTHGQPDADSWNNPAAVQSARTVLATATAVQAQHTMGWGVGNPEPSPGVYDWTGLDERVAMITSTGAVPVLVLCGAPDWMKGGPAGQTNWLRLEVAPTPDHYDDFANLAVAIAKHFPQVRHYVVWNELKGFWSDKKDRWDYEAYTEFYNVVYDALKKYDPTLAVGGPYQTMDSLSEPRRTSQASAIRGKWGTLDQRPLDTISYWLKNQHGADFVAVDATTGTQDKVVVATPVAATEKFSDIDAWLKKKTSLPIWWVESYAPAPKPAAYATAQAAAFARMAKDGVAVALQWQPQAVGPVCYGCLYTDTRVPGGGQPTVSARVFEQLRDPLRSRSWTKAKLTVKGQKLTLRDRDGATIEVNGHRNTVTVTPPPAGWGTPT